MRRGCNMSRHQHQMKWRQAVCELCMSEMQLPFALIFASALIFVVLYGCYLAAWFPLDKERPEWKNILMGCSLPLGVVLHVVLLCGFAYAAYMRHAAAKRPKRKRQLSERTPLLVERVSLMEATRLAEQPAAEAGDQTGTPDMVETQAPQQLPRDLVCSICVSGISSMGGGSECTEHQLLKTVCGHTFHETCLVQWLQRRTTCPVCRHDLRGGSQTA